MRKKVLRKVARDSIDHEDIKIKEDKKGEYYSFEVLLTPRPATRVIQDSIENALNELPWPKSMRWADHAERWVRPIQSLLCIFNKEPVSLIPFAGIDSGAITFGHRFLSSAPITGITDFQSYKKSLETGHVLIDPLERRAAIKGDADALAAKAGLKMIDDPALLDEVAGLVEWPVALMGSIDDEFMEVPPEVLTTTMRKNQKYFALEDSKGKLAPKFILVANKETPDGGAAIVAGNERVLRARLADAKFFWDQDRKQTLAFRTPLLEEITFHAKLGSLAEKIDRVEALAADLADVVGADKDHVRSAVSLSKADLVSGMVIEFPDLQGTMGRYYALNDGESPDVADAIAEHYSPQGPSDDCPTAPVSVTVALADKIDTLVGFWAIDEKPTGSKDPYALRRAALGVIRLVIENNIRMPLLNPFRSSWTAGQYMSEKDELMDLLSFFADRLKVHLKEKGIRHDLISAVFALGNEDDLVRLLARVEALGTFLDTEDGANLLTAYKRAANILRIEEKKDKTSYDAAADAKVLEQKEEQELHKVLTAIIDDISQNLAAENYSKAMAGLASLRAPVDAFFDEVTVNCEEATLRVNRLRLLSQIRTTMNQVADFSQIEGGER